MTDVELVIGDAVELAVEVPRLEEFSIDTYELRGAVVRKSDRGCGIRLDTAPAPFRDRRRLEGHLDRAALSWPSQPARERERRG